MNAEHRRLRLEKRRRAYLEARRRRRDMVREWGAKGHPPTACVGHTYPLPDCPNPEVHDAR